MTIQELKTKLTEMCFSGHANKELYFFDNGNKFTIKEIKDDGEVVRLRKIYEAKK